MTDTLPLASLAALAFALSACSAEFCGDSAIHSLGSGSLVKYGSAGT